MIKYFGFSYPPMGVIGALEQTAPPDSKFYILDPIGGESLPYHELDADCWVIITTNEGSSHLWFDRLIPMLNDHGVDNDHIIIRSCCLWDPGSPVQHIHTIVDECSDFATVLKTCELNVDRPTHHFVCLNRGHRWQRYQLIQNILDRGIGALGKITYLELPHSYDPRFEKLSGQDVTWHEQRDLKDPDLRGALFNVVCETAYEPEPGSDSITHHHRPGMTEKSYKCFALYQVPIWLAPYRAVYFYRKLGFDVFDDLIDHNYDLEPDPEKRIAMVADQVEKISKMPLSALVDLKQKFFPRFEHNFKQLQHYAHNFDTEIPQWKALFLSNNLI